MIKSKALKIGDRVEVVSLSSGMAGDDKFIHRYELGKKRLEDVFGLKVTPSKHALAGFEFIKNNPAARAQDLMDAFLNPDVDGIICSIGGDDTIRTLPFIDFDIIKNNPKIFMSYSDTTINHFMMYKAGLISFYGPCIISEFAENVAIHDYTINHVKDVLFSGGKGTLIKSSDSWTSEKLPWSQESNNHIKRELKCEEHGFEIINGSGTATGTLLGGCVDVFPMLIGTSIWPDAKQWRDKILFLETSEDYPAPREVLYILRNMAAQGIMDVLSGVIIGKPKDERYYEEYKAMYAEFFSREIKRVDIPVIYNVNFGHTAPMCVLPYGVLVELNCDDKTIKILENCTLN